MRHWRRELLWRLKHRPPRPDALPKGTPDPACPDFAVGAIAVSLKYADWCLTMIDSLRHRGGYSGPVYVVTDQPSMFEQADNVYPITVPYSRVRLISKSLKPMLFEWIPYRFVAYIDADVIVTGDVRGWYERSRQRLAEVDSPLLTFPANNPLPGSFHGGLLFAERKPALPFLKCWLRMLRSGRYLSDQAALRRVATRDTPAYFAEDGFMYLYRMLEQGERRVPMFTHVTDGTITGHQSAELQAFLREQLGVRRMPSHFGK